MLRAGLLAGRTIALGGGTEMGAALGELGAATAPLPATLDEEEAARAVTAALEAHGAIDALLHDLRPAFGAGGQEGLRAALDTAWIATRAVANAAFIPQERGGRVTFVAPAPSEDPAAAGVRAAAENLARTLSIEWARYGIRTVAITPGPATTDAQLAALAAYLASPAGDYFSGARLALGEVALSA